MTIYERDTAQSADAANNPWIYDCDVLECYFVVSAPSKEDAEKRQTEHKERTCPMTGQSRYAGKSIGEKLWDMLDTVIDNIKEVQARQIDEQTRGCMKGEAFGLADALVLMMQPHYTDRNAILKQANKRWKMRMGLIEEEPTPGYKFNPMPQPRPVAAQPARVAPTPATTGRRAATVPIPGHLSADDIKSIVAAYTDPNFPNQMICQAYNITLRQLEQLSTLIPSG